MRRALAIIPARGGSKRLPKKNLRLLGGKPLVKHTLDAVQESGCFDEAILSSDNPDILALAEGVSIVKPVPRPKELSGDFVTALEVVNVIVSNKDIQKRFDIVALLLPTAPFRTARHIRDGFELLTDEWEGVVSLTQYEFPPQLSVTLEESRIRPVFEPCPLITGNTRSQDQAVIYRPNGAFYIQKMGVFLRNQNFWKGNIRGYVMDRADSVDIDSAADLEFAEIQLARRNNGN